MSSGIFRNRKALAVVGWLLFSGAIWMCATYYKENLAREQARELRSEAALIAQALEQNLLRTLEAIESVHALVQAQADLMVAGADRGANAIRAHLANIARAEKFGILQVAIIGRDGWLEWSSVPDFEPVWVGDREHFVVQRDSRPGLFLSRPIIGRASGRWSVQLTRPILDVGGGFSGVAVVSLDPISLSSSMAELGLGTGHTLSVLRTLDGALLATSREPEARLSELPPTSQPVLTALRSSSRGVLSEPIVILGTSSIVAFRELRAAPMAVLAGVSTVDDAGPRLRRWVDGASLSVIGLGGLLLVVLQQREARRRARFDLARLDAERKAAEDAQRYAERLIGGLPSAVYSGRANVDGMFEERYLSASATRLTGWPRAEIGGASGRGAKIELPRGSTLADHFREALRVGESAIEYRLRRPDASWVWLRDAVRVLERHEDGSADVVGSLTDITSKRLLQAQANAAGKLATLGEMATGLAHELNQPIAIMSLAAENAAQALQSSGQEAIPGALRRLARIAHQAGRARAIVDHLRIFGRNDGGALEAVSMQSVVDGALTMVKSALRTAEVEIAAEIPHDLPPVLARAIPVEQVLVNLLLNARDAFEDGPPGLCRCIRIEADTSAPAVLELVVSDNGPGFPPEVLERLFEPFFTTKEPGKGTGLGLSICHGIMKGMGGAITATNREDGGAEFRLRFKLATAEDGAPQMLVQVTP